MESEGYSYNAVCNGTTALMDGSTFVNGIRFNDALDVGAPPPRCTVTIGLVGHEVATTDPRLLPAGGKEKDREGWITSMSQSGDNLMLSRWRDNNTHTEELFKIVSVAKAAR